MACSNRSFPLGVLASCGLLVLSAVACSRKTAPTADSPAETASTASPAPDPDVIQLTPEQVAAAKIESAPTERRLLSPQIETTGQVDFEQDRLAHVTARIPGRVHQVFVNLGDRVRKGQVLAVLDSIELGKAVADYRQAKARESLARENFEREQKLFEGRVSSQQEMLTARSSHLEAAAALKSSEETLELYGLGNGEIAALADARSASSLLPIVSPLAGKVVEKHLTVGELASPERDLLSIADLAHVWIWIDVYERDLRRVHLDDQVQAQVDAYPGETFQGTVSFVGDRVDVASRTLRARLDILNPEEKLRPGMFARVVVTDPHVLRSGAHDEPVLAVPEAAVQRAGETFMVFVPLEGNRFRRAEVKVGRRSGGFVEILSGLQSTDRVVTGGAFQLKSEAAKGELGEGE